MDFDSEYEKFLEEQLQSATGRRREMLLQDLTAERKMFKEALWPAFRSFQGFIMQYELVTFTGVTIFIDAFFAPMRIAFESEGFVAHAENITRDRFDFERFRIRTLANKGILYYPFTWDELNKKPDKCRTSLFELLGTLGGGAPEEFSLYERALITFASRVNRPIRLIDARLCLGKGEDTCRRVIRDLESKHILKPMLADRQRNHAYVLAEGAARRWGDATNHTRWWK